jgi:photosystem I subunit 3|tara:strand:+ start:254 stop:835 length:582 start_codon:yes stop_codon:yes gene_type:complete
MKLNIKSLFSKIIILTIFSGFILNVEPQVANAAFNNLTPCKDSAPFKKRLASSVKKLENRLKLYIPETKEAQFLIKEVEATKARFAKYENSTLLCGKEGLPRIIASGQWDHATEFIIPGSMFLYITGWIGWVGRKYVRYASTTKDAYESEIIINVPVALSIMNSGFLWPLDAWKEFTTGDLLASDDDITISPR